MAVALRCETGRARLYAARLRADARRLMTLVGLAACELSIVIADDRFVHALNREFRGKDRPTDVLSFSQLEEARRSAARQSRAALLRASQPGGAGAGLRPRRHRRQSACSRAGTSGHACAGCGTALGDVVISLDTARRQARALASRRRRGCARCWCTGCCICSATTTSARRPRRGGCSRASANWPRRSGARESGAQPRRSARCRWRRARCETRNTMTAHAS